MAARLHLDADFPQQHCTCAVCQFNCNVQHSFRGTRRQVGVVAGQQRCRLEGAAQAAIEVVGLRQQHLQLLAGYVWCRVKPLVFIVLQSDVRGDCYLLCCWR